MARYLNLTPHEIAFHHSDGRVEIFPSDGRLILRPEKRKPYIFDGYPVVQPSTDPTVSGLPAPDAQGSEEIILIVSRYAAEWVSLWWNGEVLVPDTSKESAIRDNNYRIVGVRRWERWSSPVSRDGRDE